MSHYSRLLNGQSVDQTTVEKKAEEPKPKKKAEGKKK